LAESKSHLASLTGKYNQNTVSDEANQSGGGFEMRFGQRVRDLRKARNLTQRELAARLGVSFTYISKVENEKLHFGDFPSEKFIHKLADALDAEVDELLLLADKVPETIRKRVRERPSDFHRLASLDDQSLNRVLATLDAERPNPS
jgi:HTH-type transcriptional regulator, competence development regulator